MRKEFRELTRLEKALEVLDEVELERTEEKVELSESNGRVLSRSIDSPIDVPGFDRSKMDGYAVRAKDTYGANDSEPVELSYSGKIETGEIPEASVEEGEAFEISTGAVMPEGGDAVVMVEETSRSDSVVEIHSPVSPNENVMSAGFDVSAGERVLKRRTRLTPREIGLLAALGFDEVPVYEKPKVGIVSTGNEIVRPGNDLSPGQIYDVNSFSVSAGVEDAGGEPKIYDHAEDDYDEMSKILSRACEKCDLVLSSGSTSASSSDVVYRVIEKEGELLLHGIAVKPGKPTVFGRLNGTPYIGLPGNPISALTIFNLFASRLIREGAGLSPTPESETLEAKTVVSISSEVGRTRLLPVGLVESPERGLLAYSLDKGSGATTSLSEADGYIVVDADVNYLEKDESVEVVMLGRDVEVPGIFGAGEDCAVVNEVLDGWIEDEGSSARYLNTGAVDGVRKVRDGISDLAGVDLPKEEIDELGVEDVELVRGYERSLGLMFEKPGSYGSVEEVLETEDVIAGRTESSGTRVHINELVESSDVRILEFGSEESVANAVEEGKVNVGVGLEFVAEKRGLGFLRVKWENFDFLVSKERKEKEGVERFLEKVEEYSLEDVDGYRGSENQGEVFEEW